MRLKRPSWFGAALTAVIAARVLFLLAYPFGFSHLGDGGSYTYGIVRYLAGHPYIPNALRVTGTYAAFVIPLVQWLGSSAFTVVLIQHLLGVLAALVAYWLVLSLSGSRGWAIAALVLTGFLPRELIYEHIVLVDALASILTLIFGWVGLRWMSTRKPVWGVIAGLLGAALVLSRGQGLFAIPAGLLLVIAVGCLARSLRQTALALACYFLPLVAIVGYYAHLNQKYNHFFGLAIHGDYHMFWVTTNILLDYESPLQADLKEIVRPCVQHTNEVYTGDATWAGSAPECMGAMELVLAHYDHDLIRVGQVMPPVNKEAVRAHPLAYAYRVLFNFADFTLHKYNIGTTHDLVGAFLEGPAHRYHLDPKYIPTVQNREFNPQLSATPRGLDWLRIPGEKMQPAFRLRKSVDRVLSAFHSLNDFRLFSLAAVLFLTLLLIPGCPRTLFPGLWLFLLWLGQIATTVAVGNAFYDRYFVPCELLGVTLLCASCAVFARLPRERKLQTAVLLFGSSGVAVISWHLFHGLPLPYPFHIDRPLLGMPVSGVVLQQRYVFSFLFAVLTTSVTVVSLVRSFSRVQFTALAAVE